MSPRALNVLVVEDSEKDATLILRELRKSGWEVTPERVASAGELGEALGRSWDVVLADFELPGFDGFAALTMVREVDPEVPCIVVSGRIGEEVAVEAMRAGAADFVPKDRLTRLATVVERELREAAARRARAREAKRARAQHAVAALLASGRSAIDAAHEALAAIGECFDWGFAGLWTWEPRERLLRCAALWSSTSFGAFEAETRGLALPSGTGMPGRVFASGEPLWIPDFPLEPLCVRRSTAEREGIRGALAVPIAVGGEVCCVMELFSRELREREDDTLEAIRTLAWQLGQAIGRERALEALRSSEAHKAAVIEGSLDAVVTADERGRVVEFNPAAERIFGYARDEIVGKDMTDTLLPPSLRQAHRREVARYLATGETTLLGRRIELPGMRKDGSEFPAEVAIARVEREGEPPLFTMFIRDLTESAKLLSAVQRAEASQRVLADVGAALMESLDHVAVLPRIALLLTRDVADWCAIHVVDGGRIEQAASAHRRPEKTPRIEELWREKPPSRHCEVGPARVVDTATPQHIEHVTPEDVARIARDEDEARRITELGAGSYLAVPLVARGQTVGALTLVREPGRSGFDEDDVELCTEIGRRCAVAIENARLYREVQESVRARDDFLMIASHELQTPLTPLRMRAQELVRTVEEHAGRSIEADRIVGTARAIERSSRRLTDLVDRLLDVSRVTVGRIALERSRFDLVALARQAASELADELERAGSKVRLAVPDEPVEGEWDRRRIAIAMRNLLSNAAKFGRGRPVELSIARDGESVRVSVRDEGAGLPEAEVRRLFERFARPAPLRQYGGFGLGLWIVRQIAEEHGGRVEVTSTPGQGSSFGFVLPA